MSADKFKAPEKNTPEGAGKEMSKELSSQLQKVAKQAEEEYRNAHTELSDARKGTDEKRKVNADIDFTHASQVKNDMKLLHGSIVKFVPVFKSPVTVVGGATSWRKADIDLIHREVSTRLNDPATGIRTQLTNEIGNTAAGLIKDTTDAYNDLLTQSSLVDTHKGNIEALQQQMRQKGAVAAPLIAQISIEQASLQTALQAKIRAESNYNQKSRELANKKQHLSHLDALAQWLADVKQISDEMDTVIAAGGAPADASEKLNDLVKNMNLLLKPEPLTADKNMDKIKEILNRSDIDEATKVSLMQALAA